jgi:cell pole-organizing protein PopZ
MAERNQDVLDMIAQIRARLTDLEEDVRACEAELPGMATRLDRIDDRIYLLETEVASRAQAAAAGERADEADGADDAPTTGDAPAASESKAASDDDDEGMNILTPEAKEKLGETVGDLREIGRTGFETLTEINEAIADITSPFKAFTKMGRR